MKGKKVKKDTQRISLYRVRLEKDRDLIKRAQGNRHCSSGRNCGSNKAGF